MALFEDRVDDEEVAAPAAPARHRGETSMAGRPVLDWMPSLENAFVMHRHGPRPEMEGCPPAWTYRAPWGVCGAGRRVPDDALDDDIARWLK